MNRPISLFAVAFGLLLCVGAAQAQTAANLAVVSGNGQIICQCPYGGPTQYFFAPMYVRVTDASGNRVSGAAVDWSITQGGFGGALIASQTFTDAEGLAFNTFTPGTVPFAAGFGSYLQTTVRASAGSGIADFILTQGAQAQPNPPGTTGFTPFVPLQASGGQNLTGAPSITGQIGSTVTPPIKVVLGTQPGNQPIPNVAVFIQNDQTADQGPVLSCANSQPGWGPNVVLTDASGVATCNPVFSGVPNVTGTARVIVGGAIPPTGNTASETYNFTASANITIRATAASVSQIRAVSGNQQSAQAGQALGSPLVVELLSSTGTGLAGQNVNWAVSPASAASLGSTQTTTDSAGRTQNTLRFATTANGAVTVTATSATDSTKTVSFTATALPLVTVTSLQIVGGNDQSTVVNSNFSAPLVVQVNSTAGPASGVQVSFTVNGPATLSSSSATTGTDGRAQVTAQAGSTAGSATVTASAAGFSQTFNLTVSPPGPSLSANSFFNAADLQRGMLSPCSLATVIAPGVAPGLQGMVTAGIVGQLPGVIANTRVTVGGIGAPMLSVGRNASGQEQATFQVPCEVNPGNSVPVVVSPGAGSASVNIPILAASPGIFTQTGTDGVVRAVVIRPEGSFVTPTNPARRGENLTALLTGLGGSIPVVGSNSVAAPGSITSPQGTVIVGMAGRGVPLLSAQVSPDQVGVWLVQFTVPSDIATGNQNFSVSVVPTGGGSPISSGSGLIPVQ